MAEEPRARRADRARTGLPRWGKAILLLVVIAVSIVILFTWVFPWVEEMTQDPTMGVGHPLHAVSALITAPGSA